MLVAEAYGRLCAQPGLVFSGDRPHIVWQGCPLGEGCHPAAAPAALETCGESLSNPSPGCNCRPGSAKPSMGTQPLDLQPPDRQASPSQHGCLSTQAYGGSIKPLGIVKLHATVSGHSSGGLHGTCARGGVRQAADPVAAQQQTLQCWKALQPADFLPAADLVVLQVQGLQ